MGNKHTNTKLVVAYGCLSFVIFLWGSINGISTYYRQGTLFPLTETTVWMGLIGLFSAAIAMTEIYSNIKKPIIEAKSQEPAPLVPSAYIRAKIPHSLKQTSHSEKDNHKTDSYTFTKKHKITK